jgi:oxygen-independent coproporphyrinogen-3 oxidase
MKKSVPALYIHIPFCNSICSYCDFPKLLSKTNYQDAYIQRLILELSKIDQKEFETIYIGGGTPSSLSLEQLELLLSFIESRFQVNKEYSFEANPESLSLEKIQLLKKHKVNRVSLGVQTFNEESLKLLNRKHTKKDVFECVSNLQSQGITNINLDFIFGLKIENQSDYLNNILTASKLGVKHISYYSLQIEEGTKLFKTPDVRKDPDDLADDYEYIVKALRENGYHQYEVSNFSLENFESKHNLTYWRNQEYYGIGLGATGLVDSHRIAQNRNILKFIENKDTVLSDVCEDLEETEFNYLMLNLRLVQGFALDEFKEIFKKDFLQAYKSELEDLKDDLIITDKRVSVVPQKLFILDAILVDLLHFKEQ